MSENAITQNIGYPNFIPEVWGKKLSSTLDVSGVMMKCVNKNYEGDIKAAGDTVHIRSFGDVAVSTYTGANISYSELTSPSQTLVIDQQKMFAFKVNDIAKKESEFDIIGGYMDRAKAAVDVAKDTFLLGKHADVTSGSTVGTQAAPVILAADTIYSKFVQLAKALKESNALSNGQSPWVVINPEIEAVLIQAPEFIHSTKAGDTVLREGSIGKIAGLDVLVSTNLNATAVTGDEGEFTGDLFYVLAGTNDAITYASQVVELEQLRDPNTFSTLVRGLYVYGGKTVVPAALAKLICTTTSYS